MTTPPTSLDGADFAARLSRGDASVVDWLAARCERVASRQFSPWAWRWIRDDFVGDLTAQLATVSRGSGLEIRGAAEPYVDTAIRNLCRRYFLDLARVRRQVPMEHVVDRPVETRDSLARVAAVIDLKRVLGRLSPECRKLIQQKYVMHLSLDEIGRDGGIPEKTARSRLHTCRERLRTLWKDASTDRGAGALS